MSIIVRLKGGIGNQLFMYSAARRLAMINNQELLLDHISGFSNDVQYKQYNQLDHFNILCRKATSKERLEPFSIFRRSLKKIYNYFLPFNKRNYIKQDSLYFDRRILDLKIRHKLYFEGYFQSEDYFKDVEFQIRKDLKIKPPRDDLNNKFASRIKKNFPAVAVHLRFFQKYKNNEDNINYSINLAEKYYYNAILIMNNLFPNAHYFIFSDRPKEARNIIQVFGKPITFVNHNVGDVAAYADLWLMTHCQHFIIANSTFSWWGAWLSNNPKKIVIAPKINNNSNDSWRSPKLLPKLWIKI